MDQRLYDAFDAVRADDALRMNTRRFLRGQRARRGTARRPFLRMAAACCCLVVLLGMGGFSVWAQAVSYVSVDADASVELAVNRFGRVVGATAYGPDGAAALDAAAPRNRSYTDAVELLLEHGISDGSLLSFTVQAEDGGRSREMLDSLRGCAAGHLDAGARVECHTVGADLREAAAAHHLSQGKYRAILDLQAEDPGATLEEYRHCSMRELQSCAENCRSGEAHGRGRHHGHSHE